MSTLEEKRERYDEQIVAEGTFALATIAAVGIAGRSRETAAIREERRKRLSLIQEEERRKELISKNTCPSCEGKLLRGKRNKKRDYQREWTCKKCSQTHYK